MKAVIACTLVLLWTAKCFCAFGSKRTTLVVSNTEDARRLKPQDLDFARMKSITIPPLSTSTFHLARLAEEEVNLAHNLTRLAQVLLTAHQAVTRYLSSWEELEAAGAGRDKWVEHPFHSYAFTKHLALGWPHLEEALQDLSATFPDVESALGRRKRTGVPTLQDMSAVSGGVARLHDFYRLDLGALDSANLLSGLSLDAIPFGVSPSVWDLFYIGSEAVTSSILGSGVDFLKAALTRVKANSSRVEVPHPFEDDQPDADKIQSTLKKVSLMHDQVLERKGPRSNKHSTHLKPVNRTLARKKKYHKKPEEVVLGEKGKASQGVSQFVRLCNGEDLRTVTMTSQLYCRYVTNGSPLYAIGPLRMEVQSLYPYVGVLYNVVTVSEAKELRFSSFRFLNTSSTLRYNGAYEVSHQRTSATGWLYEHDHDLLPVLTSRIENILGVNAEENFGSEAYQLVNYGVGGHYTVHHDSLNLSTVFNRVATFLIYLTDVHQGGSTVFPWLGMGVKPRLGSAVFWYNLKNAGDRDERVEHGACPVLLGDKWVINKWIYYGAQAPTIPCSMEGPEAVARQPLF